MATFSSSLEIIMGVELYRPRPQYIARYVIQPQIIHDWSMQPGSTVRMKRFGFWNDPGSYTLSSRQRDKSQVIGTGGGRGLPEEAVTITLQEFTGPSTGNSTNPNEPGVLKINMYDLKTMQRNLYDMSRADQFHQSIGSETLFEDYRRWKDSIYIGLALAANPATSTTGQVANNVVGGYYNPAGVANGGTYNTATGAPRLDFTRDVLKVVSDMRSRLVPPFQSNFGDVYHGLASPGFMLQLQQDSRFLQVTQYPGVPVSMLPMTAQSATLPQMMPLQDWTMSPNELVKSGGFYGQTGFMHSMVMPLGFIMGGVRWFETTNLPTIPVQLTTSGLASQGYADGTNVVRQAECAIIIGSNAIGEAIWGEGPQVLLNENTDYRRFLMAIWQEYGGYSVLNSNNITVMRTFANF